MLTVGLTGGIASGKSLAATEFTALGVPVLNADLVAREVVTAGTPALARIAEAFGPDFLLPDGTMDRRKMREHVFAHPEERRKLEAITHPAIRGALIAWRDAQRAPYCILDVPILFESGMAAQVDRVLVIDCATATQVQRLVARDGISHELAQQMLAAQATREFRLENADDVIENAGSIDALRAAIGRMHAFYRKLATTGEKPATGLHLP